MPAEEITMRRLLSLCSMAALLSLSTATESRAVTIGTDVSGTITTTTWIAAASPYNVMGAITVPAGEVLTIEAGVDVLLKADVAINVEGALHAQGTSTDSVRFLKGTVTQWHGLRFSGADSSSLVYTRISDGKDANGGGIAAHGPGSAPSPGLRLALVNSVVSGNDNSALGMFGGGMYLDTVTVYATDCRFVGNAAKQRGGAVYGVASTVRMTRCVVEDNTTGYGEGGGFYMIGGSLDFTDGSILRNTAGNVANAQGGAIFGNSTPVVLRRSLIAGNVAGGTGIYNAMEFFPSAAVTIDQCTIADSIGGNLLYMYQGSLQMTNSIMWSGSGQVADILMLPSVSTVDVTYSDVGTSGDAYTGDGNINADPLFVDAANGDYTLQAASPCVNTGNLNSALDLNGTRADMGYTGGGGVIPPYSATGTLNTTTWTAANSPVHVVGEVTVPAGETLTIEPGVDVQFDANVQFIVNGALHAMGTSIDSIRFVKGTSSTWQGLLFGGADSSSLAYTRVSNGSRAFGAGISIDGPGPRLALLNSDVSGNSNAGGGSASGGAMYVDSAAVYATDSRIEGNSTKYYGGGIWARESAVTMTACTVKGNSTTNTHGGGFYMSGGSFEFTDGSIVNNTANNQGGGIYANNMPVVLTRSLMAGNLATASYNAIMAVGSTVTIDRCTIADDAGDKAVYIHTSSLEMNSSIIWSGSGQVTDVLYFFAETTVDVTYSNVGIAGAAYPGTGNINATPSFVNTSGGDYNLTGVSPCINAGDPAAPLDDDGSRADMGAFQADITTLPNFVSGSITTTTWTQATGTYHVYGQVTIPTGNTLTIEPGVDVLFDSDVQLVVDGALHASGTDVDSVRFLAGDAAEWGGIRISGGDSSSFTYVRISDGVADGLFAPSNWGGGIYATGAGTRVAMDNSVVVGNSAEYRGGGIKLTDNATMSLTDCSVADNVATTNIGGGIHAEGASVLTLLRTSVLGNSAPASLAGGIFVTAAVLNATSSIIEGNSAAHSGGGIYMNATPVNMVDCTVRGNTTTNTHGGGFYTTGGSLTFTDGTIVDNVAAAGGGGGLYTSSTSVLLEGSLITGNSDAAGYNAAAIYGDTIRVRGCTIADNFGSSPRAILVSGGHIEMVNSILWNSTGPYDYILHLSGGGTADVTYSDIGVAGPPIAGTGNINADPLFVYAAGDNYQIHAGSPCLDTGDPTGAKDPDHTNADMGAFYIAQNTVYGYIGEPIWEKVNSPYRVVEPCTVGSRNTLTIEAGVDVLFDADVQFVVEGALNAVGTQADSVRFIKGRAAEWGGMRIGGSDSTSLAVQCQDVVLGES